MRLEAGGGVEKAQKKVLELGSEKLQRHHFPAIYPQARDFYLSLSFPICKIIVIP